MLALVLVACCTATHILAQTCTDIPVVKGTGPITFQVIGDWGRLGAIKSLTPAGAGGYDLTGFCTSKFNDSYVENVIGGVGQLSVAQSMNRYAKWDKPQFILNTGDNFYECGVDTPLRLDLDWNRVYGSCNTQGLAQLKWYNTIGNHDIPLTSVQSQLDYAKFEPRWVFPCRYYAVDYVNTLKDGSTVSLRIAFINTSPFVTSYSKPTNKYYGPEILATAAPAAISAQLDWLDSVLKAATSAGIKTIVVGHHPMVSSSDKVFGPFAAQVTDPGSSVDEGMPDLTGTPSYTKLYNIIRDNKVSVYFNGHDHILSHTVDPVDPVKHKTQYVTTGAGSLGDASAGCGIKRPYVKWVGGTYDKNSTCADTVGNAKIGYNLVTVDAAAIKVSFYTLADPATDETQKAYSFQVSTSTTRRLRRMRHATL